MIELIASRNPDGGKRIRIKTWWSPLVTLALVIIISLGLWQWGRLPFMTAFAYSLLVLSGAGAFYGILMV
jgi:hypothetical protein